MSKRNMAMRRAALWRILMDRDDSSVYTRVAFALNRRRSKTGILRDRLPLCNAQSILSSKHFIHNPELVDVQPAETPPCRNITLVTDGWPGKPAP